MFELHGSGDPATLKLLIGLEELGLSYRFTSLDLQKLEQWAPAHRALAPQGAVPVLVDGACVMDDAAIALLYLADSHPKANLLPANPADHYDVQALIDVLDGALLASVNLIGWHRQQPADARASYTAALAAVPGRPAVAGWSAVWRDAESDRLQRALEKVGRFDNSVLSRFGLPRLLPDAVSPERTPRLWTWLERLRARPAVRRALTSAVRGGVTRYAPPQ